MSRYVSVIGLFLLCALAHASATLYVLDNKPVPMQSLKGKWVVLNYWANWCQPCLDEISIFNRFYQEEKHHVALFAVNFDNPEPELMREINRKLNIQYPSLTRDPADSLALGDIVGVPATFVFNPNGELVARQFGKQTLASLKALVGTP